MRRAEIPAALAKARAADIDRIPSHVLAKLTRADLANRLVAAGEFRRRGRQQHQPADTARFYADLTGEVLGTADPERAAALIKSAGVGVTIGTGRAAARPAARPAASGTLVRKAAAPRQLGPGQWRVTDNAGASAVVNVPVLAGIASDSAKIIAKAANTGQLGALAREVASIDAALSVKAAEYERQAAVVTDPELRRGYRELAARERQSAGAR